MFRIMITGFFLGFFWCEVHAAGLHSIKPLLILAELHEGSSFVVILVSELAIWRR